MAAIHSAYHTLPLAISQISSKTIEIFVVPFNTLFKLEDTSATKQEDFKYGPCSTQVNMKEISKNLWWHIGYYCVSTLLPTASHTSQGCHFNITETSSSW